MKTNETNEANFPLHVGFLIAILRDPDIVRMCQAYGADFDEARDQAWRSLHELSRIFYMPCTGETRLSRHMNSMCPKCGNRYSDGKCTGACLE